MPAAVSALVENHIINSPPCIVLIIVKGDLTFVAYLVLKCQQNVDLGLKMSKIILSQNQ